MKFFCSTGEKKISYKNKYPQTTAMRYSHENEPIALEAYAAKLQVEHHSGVVVTRTGFHIDYLICAVDNPHFNSPMGNLCATI